VRGEEPERQSRLASLGRAGTTPQSPVNQGSGSRSRLCSNPSRAYPGRAPACPGKGRATDTDGAHEQSALTPAQPSAEVSVALDPLPGQRAKDRTGKTRRREDHLDEARPEPGRGFAAARQRPSLECGPLALTALSALNRRVRTRLLGGVGAGEGDLPGYPIRGCLKSLQVRAPREFDG